MSQTFIRAQSAVSAGRIPVGLKVIGVCALMVLAAQVRVPVPGTPVPMTLQSFVVVLAGLTLSPAAAASAMLMYVGLGTAGLPVFSAGSLGLFGPTGGYLVGFVVGGWLISVLRGSRRCGVVRLSLAGGAGLAALFLAGVIWLAVYTGGDLPTAVAAGLVPFLLKGLTETALAVSMVKTVGRRSHSTF